MSEHRECIVCSRPGPFPFLFAPPGYPGALVRCPHCGLVFQDPQPAAARLAESYYHDAAFSRMLFGELRGVTTSMARAKLGLVRSAGLVRPGARVLDVGCSSGAWLEVAAASGMPGVGVEVGEATASGARARGLDVRTGTLRECFGAHTAERFDLITFWDVLEHLSDPREELALARGLLREGGALAATCPNVAGWYPRLTLRLFGRLGVWEYPELPVHLYDFSPPTLSALLRRTGYEASSVRTFATPFRHYRGTTLALERLGGGPRAVSLRAAFEALRVAVYPAAALCGRGNSMFVVARPPNGSPSPASGSGSSSRP